MALDDYGPDISSFDPQAADLNRRRQLALMLQQQSFMPQFVNTNAKGSLLQPLTQMFQAYVGNRLNQDVTQQQAALQTQRANQNAQAFSDWQTRHPTTPALPARPDMNLPGDLAGVAASQPTTGAEVGNTSPTPGMLPQPATTGLAQGQMIPRNLGSIDVTGYRDNTLQRDPWDAAAAIKEQQYNLPPGTLNTYRALEKSGIGSVNKQSGAAGPYQIMPNLIAAYSKQAGRTLDPNDPTDGANMAAQVAADAQKRYPGNEAAQVAYYNGGSRAGDQVASGQPTNPETTSYLARWKAMQTAGPPGQTQATQSANNAVLPPQAPQVLPMSPQAPTPAPSLAGPAVPGALPPMLPQPQQGAPQAPMIPGGVNMAPRGITLPPQAAQRPTTADMWELSQNMAPGPQRAAFQGQILAQLAKEPETMQVLESNQALKQQLAELQSATKYGTTGMNVAGRLATNANTVGGAMDRAKLAADTRLQVSGGQPQGDFTLKGNDYLASLPPEEQMLVQGLATGQDPMNLLSQRNNNRAAYMKMVLQFDPSFTTNRVKMRQEFSPIGQTGKNLVAADTAVVHGDTVLQMMEAQNNGQFPLANQLMNLYKSQTGDATINNVQTAVQAYTGELTKAFRGNGGAESDIQNWNKRFSENLSPEMQTGAVEAGLKLLAGRLGEQNNAWKRGMNWNQDAPMLVSPEAQNILNTHGIKIPGYGQHPDPAQQQIANSPYSNATPTAAPAAAVAPAPAQKVIKFDAQGHIVQ